MEEPTKRVTRVNRGQNMKRHIEELLSNDVKYFSSQSTESTNKKQRVEKDVKVTKSDTEDHADTSSQDEYDGEVRCRPCGATKDNYDEDEDTLGDMVQCDQCKTWQHAKCMGIRPNVQYPIFINVMFVLENPYHNQTNHQYKDHQGRRRRRRRKR